LLRPQTGSFHSFPLQSTGRPSPAPTCPLTTIPSGVSCVAFSLYVSRSPLYSLPSLLSPTCHSQGHLLKALIKWCHSPA
jgi:hypothetical protein